MSARFSITSVLVALLGLLSFATQAQTIRYIHTDALGSPVAVTNVSRTVIEISEYEPYGQLVNRPLTAGPGYTGHVMDVSTGLAYMQQRYYGPSLGRFLSVDPVAANPNTGANFNRYKYAANNPYSFTDPDGRQESSVTRAMDRDNRAVLRGEMSPEEHTANAVARGLGGVAAAVVVGAAVAAPTAGMAVLANPGAVATATEVAAGAAGVTGTAGALGGGTAGKITRSSLNRVKALVRSLSTPNARENPIGQAKVGKLERIVEKAGGQLRNDGANGVKGSSAGTPHVQTEGLGNKTDSRHIWTEPNVRLRNE